MKEALNEGELRGVSTEQPAGVRVKAATAPSPWLKTTLYNLYHRCFVELILRQHRLLPSKDGRHIPLDLDREHALIDERRGRQYISNAIRTSRYTIYDFLPKQLIFQFSRLANFYLLCVGIPQTIPGLSTTGNYTTIMPLLFFVLLMVAKEGFDDWKRHRLDKIENARTVKVLKKAAAGYMKDSDTTTPNLEVKLRTLHGPATQTYRGPAQKHRFHWTDVKWRDVSVGDVIKLTRDEDVPADMVLLHADGDNGFAYVETMALDGETNLKTKQVSAAFEACSTVQGMVDCRAEFVVEDPNPNLYQFHGRISIDDKALPLTLNEVVYRGSTLRNTPQAVGIVVNTGEECKIRRNANRHPNAKKPALEKVANKIVISLAIYVIILSVGCSMGYLLWQKSTEQRSWYLADAQVRFVEIIIGFVIQFNNVIPLALYVGLELVKLGQMIMLNWDIEMYDEGSDTPARCNTNTILENLGQIGYVFSDKTGTLTENVMKFRKLSIVGTPWLHDADAVEESPVPVEDSAGGKGAGVVEVPTAEQANARSPWADKAPVATPVSAVGSLTGMARSTSQKQFAGRADRMSSEPTTRELMRYIRSSPSSDFSKRAFEYILGMALCHTCLPETRNGEISFQAASPDELALVQAAKDLGYLLVERSSRSITLEIDNDDGSKSRHYYEVLDIIEFSSKRKRMSIIVRCPDGRIWLVVKGADSTILPRLRLAHLATQQANEVRKSSEMERELGRMKANEARNSFGGRPSLVLRRSSTLPIISAAQSDPSRGSSLEVSAGHGPSDCLKQEVPFRATAFGNVPVNDMDHTIDPRLGEAELSFLNEASCADDKAIFSQCFRHLDGFAKEGLRTLLFAHRYLSDEEYATWKKIFTSATTSLVDRQERIEAAAEDIEQSLELTGVSAIEDRLQRGVPETVDRLRRANIKIWMLTGDKKETAINIAHSAKICLPESRLLMADASKGDLKGQLRGMMGDLQFQPDTNALLRASSIRHTVMVIDGATLAVIEDLSAGDLKQIFYAVIANVDSVICCRASPAQKAGLVRAIRDILSIPSNGKTSIFHALFDAPRPLTLAIGDGANDLAMLAEAHVGVGISGKEGLQAARVADYSIAQFRFLSRLLLVHGRWNYVRTARFVLATFWKEMFFYLPTTLYQRYNGYTGTSLYESWSLTVLNVLFTSLCVIAVGICEQDLKAETLLAVPELYVFGQRNQGLNMAKYAGWMVCAVAEGLLVWFGCWAAYGCFGPVRDEGLFALGDLVFTAAISWVNLKLLILDPHNKNIIILSCFFITIAGWWVWQLFLSGAYNSQAVTPYAVKMGFISVFGPDPVWWLALVVVLGALVAVELAYRVVKRCIVATAFRNWGGVPMLSRLALKEFLCSCFPSRTPNSGGIAYRQRNAEEWSIEMWQEFEKDPAIEEILKSVSRDDPRVAGIGEVETAVVDV